MIKDTHCETCNKLTMAALEDVSQAIYFASQWCKCSDESKKQEQGELASMAWGLANAHAICIKDLRRRVSLLEARE